MIMNKEDLKKILEDINEKYKQKNKDFDGIKKALFIMDKVSNEKIFKDKVIDSYDIYTTSSDTKSNDENVNVQIIYLEYIYKIIAKITKDHIDCYLKYIGIDENISKSIGDLYEKNYKKDNGEKLDFIYNLFCVENQNDLMNIINNKDKPKIKEDYAQFYLENNNGVIDGETESATVGKVQSWLGLIGIVGACIWIFILTQTFDELPEYAQYLLDVIPPLIDALVGIVVPIIIGIINKRRRKNNLGSKGLDYDDLMKIKYGQEMLKLGIYMPFKTIKYKKIIKDNSKNKLEIIGNVSLGSGAQLAGRDIINYLVPTDDQLDTIIKKKDLKSNVKDLKKYYFHIANKKLDDKNFTLTENFKNEILLQIDNNYLQEKNNNQNYEDEFYEKLLSLQNYIDSANKNISKFNELVKIYSEALKKYNNDADIIKGIGEFLKPKNFHTSNYKYVYNQIEEELKKIIDKKNPFYFILNPIIYNLKNDTIENLKATDFDNLFEINNCNYHDKDDKLKKYNDLIKYYNDILIFLTLNENTDHIIEYLTGNDLMDNIFTNNNEMLGKCKKTCEEYFQNKNTGYYDSSVERDVFIAYASDDLGSIVYDLLNSLEKKGIKCYLADRNLKIVKDTSYATNINSAIDNCKLFLYILTNKSALDSCKANKDEGPYANTKNKTILFYQPNQNSKVDYKKNNWLKCNIENKRRQIFKTTKDLLDVIKNLLDNANAYSQKFVDKNDSSIVDDYKQEQLENEIDKDEDLESPFNLNSNEKSSENNEFDTPIVEENNPLSFKKNDNCYVVESCNIDVTSVVIPSSYNNLPVRGIEDSAFDNCTSLTSITIPSSVTSIGRYAFEGCTSLAKIIISEGVTCIYIEDYAFYECTSLKYIILPNSLISISIEEDAFKYCTSLIYNEYDNGYYLGNDINPYLVLVHPIYYAPIFTINKNTKIICNCAFYDIILESITIPSSVISIGSNAFGEYGNKQFPKIYYAGTFDEWNNINIEEGNEYIVEADIEYNSYYTNYKQFLDLFIQKEYKSNEYDLITMDSLVFGKFKCDYKYYGECIKSGEYILLECKNSNINKIKVPSKIKGIKVGAIYCEAFKNCNRLKQISRDDKQFILFGGVDTLREYSSSIEIICERDFVLPKSFDDLSTKYFGEKYDINKNKICFSLRKMFSIITNIIIVLLSFGIIPYISTILLITICYIPEWLYYLSLLSHLIVFLIIWSICFWIDRLELIRIKPILIYNIIYLVLAIICYIILIN